MSSGNRAKAAKLGMPFGTAAGRLRKMLLFSFATKLGLAVCYRCTEPIESVDEFSIDHKAPWFFAEVPREKFFDLDNIAFAHITCNIRAATKSNRKYVSVDVRHRAGNTRWYTNNRRAIRAKRSRMRAVGAWT